VAVTRQLVGNYIIDRELGRGGMGVVYAATHRVLRKRAAIKVLADPSNNVERFFNEARAAMAIDHPGIVRIYDVGCESDGHAYIAMELLEGESLRARLDRGRLPVRVAVMYARLIAEALAAVHGVQIIHRDLKPENVIITGHEQLKLVDFGVAKLASDLAAGVKTISGALVGTPLYMSPEQCEGVREIDARSDLYSLGCMMFVMIAGEPPFYSNGMGALISMHMYDPPPALRDRCPTASPALAQIVARLLAKDPDARFQSARELADALADPALHELAATDAADATAAMPVQSPTADTPPAAELVQHPPAADTERVRSRSRLVLAVLAAILVAAGGLAISRFATGDDVAVIVPAPPVVRAVVPAVDAALPDAPPERATVTITLEGAPAGTEVRIAGKLHGVVPRIDVPRGTHQVQLVLARAGYRTLSIPIVPDRDRALPVRLQRLPRPIGENDPLEYPP
jgi:eukaryotic-like serine/threonine-protein kinase